jgi:hypothetical protein
MVRCLECGCSRIDERGIGCALCGKALGPRWEECYVTEMTKTKLLAHSEELAHLGVTLERGASLRKNTGNTLGAIALVLSVAESLDHGVLRKLILYLYREIRIPRDEILRLRLAEPEQVLSEIERLQSKTAMKAIPIAKKPAKKAAKLASAKKAAAAKRNKVTASVKESES